MKPDIRWRLVIAVAFAAVVVAFLGSAAAFITVTRRMDGQIRDITEGASPSIQALAAARVSLIRLHDLLSDEVDSCSRGRPVNVAPAAEVERALLNETSSYRAIPLFPDEERLGKKVAEDLGLLYGVSEEARHELEQGQCEQARRLVEGPLTRSTALASDDFMKDMQLNALHAGLAAQAIQKTQQEAEHLASLLNIAAVVVAMAAAGAVLFGLARRERLRAAVLQLQQERTYELEQFAARVAHDVRSPLAAVQMALDLAQRTSDQTRWVDRSRKSLKRMEQIVDDLYRFALAGGAPAPGVTPDAAEVVADVLESLQGPAAEAQLELAGEGLLHMSVACPPGALTTLLTNIVQNAIKYAGGAPGRVRVVMHRQDGRLRFSISDTGPGLPAGAAERIFQPYVRVDPSAGGGLGLGLATVKRLTQAYGGTCGVTSAPARGATFWFELPLAPRPGAAGRSAATSAPPLLSRRGAARRAGDRRHSRLLWYGLPRPEGRGDVR